MNVSSTYERTMMKSHSFENGRSHHMQQLLQRRRTQLSLYLWYSYLKFLMNMVAASAISERERVEKKRMFSHANEM